MRIEDNTVLEALYKVNSLGLTIHGLLVKKDIAKQDLYCIWNKMLLDDWPIHIRLFELYPRNIGFVDDALVKYRLHSSNMHSNELRMISFCCDTILNMIPCEYQQAALDVHLKIFCLKRDNSTARKEFRRSLIQIKLTKKIKLIKLFGITLLNIGSRPKIR